MEVVECCKQFQEKRRGVEEEVVEVKGLKVH